jgi:hypothetical protein
MSNSSFKRCDQGHYFPASKPSCPHCGNSGANDNTQNISSPKKENSMESNEKTQIIGGNSGNAEKTNIVNQQTTPVDSGDKTIIAGAGASKSNSRKLVGWLVSFTLDANGVDFKIYEGKNTIGRAADNDIKLFGDGQISSLHAVILKRGDSFFIKDEMASNPSFKNGDEIMPGETLKLEDGDLLKLGNNEFLFRKV